MKNREKCDKENKEAETDKEFQEKIRLGAQIKGTGQIGFTRLKRIDPFGDFKAEEKAGDELKQYTVSEAVKSAEHLVRDHGLEESQEVTVITDNGEGETVEEEMTLEDMSKLPKKSRLYSKLKDDGGWVRFKGEDPHTSEDETVKKNVAGVLFKTAGMIAERVEDGRIPKKKGMRAGEIAAKCIRLRDDILENGLDKYGGVQAFGALGGRGHQQPLQGYQVGTTWDNLDYRSRQVANWFFDNVKYRFSSLIVGKYISTSLSLNKPWKGREKKRKKWKKKVRDFEDLFDIFYVHMEDVFDLDNLSVYEIFDLEDYDKEHPTGKQYRALKKMMEEEGYFKEHEAITSVEITKTHETGDVFKRP